jgi:hypothetical protein
MSQAIPSTSQAPIPSLHHTSILEVSLNEYRKNTGHNLLSHPLSLELQCCNSIDGILAILQRQADTIERIKDGNKGLTKWITSSVKILHPLSAVLGDGAGSVCL